MRRLRRKKVLPNRQTRRLRWFASSLFFLLVDSELLLIVHFVSNHDFNIRSITITNRPPSQVTHTKVHQVMKKTPQSLWPSQCNQPTVEYCCESMLWGKKKKKKLVSKLNAHGTTGPTIRPAYKGTWRGRDNRRSYVNSLYPPLLITRATARTYKNKRRLALPSEAREKNGNEKRKRDRNGRSVARSKAQCRRQTDPQKFSRTNRTPYSSTSAGGPRLATSPLFIQKDFTKVGLFYDINTK